MNKVEEINDLIQTSNIETNKISDGIHTFGELYEHRAVLTAALFTEWHNSGDIEVFKSLRHYDGELCFGGGWFIVVALLPTGQIYYHYPEVLWNLFQITPVDKSYVEFDGHTSSDVIQRLKKFLLAG